MEKSVVQILAEAAFADGFPEVDVGGCHDADIGPTDLRATHADVLSRFEHSQKSCLSGEWQFTHLVEEDGSLVGRTEIAFALADGSRVGALLVTEEFAVDGALGDGSAVDGEVLLVATG